MPDRVIRDELLDSERFIGLPRNTHRLAFIVLLLNCDAFGNMEAGDGSLWRMWRDPLGLPHRNAVPEILLALVDSDLIRLYEVGEKRYAHIPRTRFRLRYMKRLVPLSPWTTLDQKEHIAKNYHEQKERLANNSPDSHLTVTGLAPLGVGVGVGVGVGEKLKVKDSLSSSQANVDAVELLKFLNVKTGRHYRPTPTTLKPILARLKEGYDVSTCKAVVVRRWRAWKDDDKMREFLRPATLFGAEKFAQYVGEVPADA